MSQSWPGPEPASPNSLSDHSGLRQSAIIAYALMLSAFVLVITAIVAVILAYIRRSDAAGTMWHGHFQNVIVVFWTMLSGFLIGIAIFPVVLGAYLSGGVLWPPFSALAIPVVVWLLAFPVLVLWALYRIIKGLVRASEGRPY